jgi:hypothetical protein
LAFIPLDDLRLRVKSKAAVPWGSKVEKSGPALGFNQDEVVRRRCTKRSRSLIIKDYAATEAEGRSAIEAKEVVEAMDTTFSLERDLQRTLRANIGQIDSNLHIVDGGKEQTVTSGRIDILARIKIERA